MNKKIIIFIVVTYGFTWLLWLPLLVNKQWNMNIALMPGQFYLASFGPLFGALISTFIIGGLDDVYLLVKRIYSFHFKLKWLIFALGLPILYGIAGVIIHRYVTGGWPQWSSFGLTKKLPGLNIWATALIWMLTYGLGEESGWRGFLLPELYRKYSPMKSILIVAMVWIIWHLPAFLFNENYMNMGFGIVGWGVSILYGSVVLTWFCKGSNWSVIPVILWHGGFDLLTASDQSAAVIAMVCSILVIIHGIFLSGKFIRHSN